jgi:hypothetical protein
MGMQDTFTRIWEEELWIPPGGWAPRSGCGSSLRYTENLRRELPKLVDDFAFKSLFDAPCGDFTWMQTVRFPEGFVYRGADIVEPMIRHLRAQHPARTFLHFDITVDPFPDTDLLLCRDCLIHLSFSDIARTFANCLRGPIRSILTTSYANAPNADIVTGDYRPLDLRSPPFAFDPPVATIEDWIEGFPPRSMMLWEMKAIERPMRRFIAAYLQGSG